MDRALASALAHRWHPIAAPVSDENVRRLLRGLELPDDGRILDLGCGFGEWLAAVGPVATAEGVGVDTSAPALVEARARAVRRSLDDRVRFEEADAATWQAGERFDAVLCVGATHAFGGLGPTLAAARRHLRPGGRVLIGEGFWEVPPTPAALEGLGAEPGELPGIGDVVATVGQHGFDPGYGHISTPAEWDDYEWSWTGALTDWALTEAPPADRAAALELARTHRRQWLEGYRGQLGFVTVVLYDVGDPAAG